MKAKQKAQAKAKCECGRPLPHHLAELGGNLSHVCSCNRAYDVVDKVFKLRGFEHNPFADRDKQ